MTPQILNVKDPFKIREETERHEGVVGLTVRENMARIFGPDFVEFDRPTILVFNGKEMMRAEWETTKLVPGDVLVFIPVVGDAIFVAVLVAVVVAAVLSAFLSIPPIANSANAREADPVYGLSGQNNKTRINEPIEKHYGLVRFWPSYASRPYSQYIGNDQYLYQLFCLGLGEYDVTQKFISDTDAANFQEVTDAVYAPGETVELFPFNVETSAEVNGLELFGPNEGEYTGAVGPFAANAAGTTTKRIEFDVVFEQGLYKVRSSGRLKKLSVEVKFEYREIDNDGNPVGAGTWTTALSKTYTLKTSTPQRFTKSVTVPAGRYEVRGVRINDSDLSIRAQDSVKWAAMRAFIDGTQNFGNVTLWAVKAKATNNLNDSSRALFNAKLQAKIPVWDGNAWTTQATRNPVWAMVDILRADYGMGLADEFLDLPNLLALANTLDAAGITFDWTFDQRGKVWEACKAAMNVARSKPLMRGPVATAVRDDPASMPVAGFNSRNILRNSMTAETRFPKKYETDGLLVEYRDPTTWKPETVLCRVDNDQGLNPKRVQLLGCTDRNQAYRWGLYQRGVEVWHRDNFRLSAGIEALALSFGDLVAIKHDLLPTDQDFIGEQSGRLGHDAFNRVTDGGGAFVRLEITLPETPVFDGGEGAEHFISLRKRTGELSGPHLATLQSGDTISISTDIDLTEFEVDEKAEPPLYFFGANPTLYQLGKVIGLRPRENYEVELTVVPYDSRVYSFDAEVAPALVSPTGPAVIPDLPVVTGLTVVTNPDDPEEAIATWNDAPGALEYVVELSTDNVDFVQIGRTTVPSFSFLTDPDTIWLRVFAINNGAGPFATWTGAVGEALVAPEAPETLTLDGTFDTDTLNIAWGAVNVATSYVVTLKVGATTLRSFETSATSYAYKAATAKIDAGLAAVALDRDIVVEVQAKNDIGTSAAISDTFSNPPPVAITSPTVTFISDVAGVRSYDFSGDQSTNYDLERVKIYVSTTLGFTPGAGNLLGEFYAATNPSGLYRVAITTAAGVTHYFRFGTIDVWNATEETLSVEFNFVS